MRLNSELWEKIIKAQLWNKLNYFFMVWWKHASLVCCFMVFWHIFPNIMQWIREALEALLSNIWSSSLKPLSHSHSGKYTENVSRDLSQDGLILVHSHCQWFSEICACVHTQPVKTRDISCDVYNAPHTISLNWRMISASARIVRSSLIAASFQFTHFSSCEHWSAFKTTGKTVEQ